MNKTAIKNFAIWARNQLIADIRYRAALMGITADGIQNALPQSTGTTEFYYIGTPEPYAIADDAIKQRKHLVDLILTKERETNYKTAYKSVIEEVAYTWFNRLIAVRFMEVNDYLPSHIRVLSSDSGKMEPDLVTTPFDADLSFARDEEQAIYQLKQENKVDEVFRILFIKQCNALNEILPELFEKTSDYTELLLNLSVIDQDGVVYHLVHDIPEEDFDVEHGGQVEIIGWLYQYYNTELKDEVFAKLKKNIKINKDTLPAATQLFTPDWIVRYMVENSLGRLWLEGHPNDELKVRWKYYLTEPEQEPEVLDKLDEIRAEYAKLSPEDIKVIDPCMGSGHILVYAFDVLMQIYETAGYGQREAARSILKNNLYGLDIDDRAFQMAYFAVMMKARQYNRRILNGEYKPNVYAIQESNRINRQQLKYYGAGLNEFEKNNAITQMNSLLDTFKDAKEYGSILSVDLYDWDLLDRFVSNSEVIGQMSMYTVGLDETAEQMKQIINQGKILTNKYHVLATNPPYMSSSNMDNNLATFTKKNYSFSKYDMSTVFMEKVFNYVYNTGLVAMINIPVWMFLSRYEGFRNNVVSEHTIVNMLHCGRGVFGADFGTTTFVIRCAKIKYYSALYKRLFDKQSIVGTLEEKENRFFNDNKLYIARQEQFSKISGAPIAYWAKDIEFEIFDTCASLKNISAPRVGIITGNNDLFIKTWWELNQGDVCFNMGSYEESLNSDIKWYPYNKGGAARDWYGNRELVVMFRHGGADIKDNGEKTGAFTFLGAQDVFFHAGITWSGLTIGRNTFRYSPKGTLFDSNKGPMVFPETEELTFYLLGLFNTKVVQRFLGLLNPTVSLQAGDFEKIPIIFKNRAQVVKLSKECTAMANVDYDSSEISVDFKKHPLV